MNKLNSSKLHNNGFLRELSYNGIGGAGPAPTSEPVTLLCITDKSSSTDSISEEITIEKDGFLVGALTGYVDNYNLQINGASPVTDDTLIHIPSYRNYQGYIFNKYPVHKDDVITFNAAWSGGGACSCNLYQY